MTTYDQLVDSAIRAALPHAWPRWRRWAEAWLSGADRSRESALQVLPWCCGRRYWAARCTLAVERSTLESWARAAGVTQTH